jgi:hypothetical protein
MASQLAGKAIRNAVYGIKLERVAAVLPATGSQNLFTVAGGRILLTTFVAEVTTVMSATATNLKWTLVPTSGITNVDLTANVLVTSLAVGNELALTVLGSAASSGAAVTQQNEIVITPGIIRATTDATNTGAVKYTITYIPLDDGANVTVL